jgi:RimJ/RimL family protein N-acetyltransferase
MTDKPQVPDNGPHADSRRPLPVVHLEAAATPSAPALLLRPWRPTDAASVVEAYRDEVLRRWTGAPVDDEDSAMRWIEEQRRDWETGVRFAFAVVDAPTEAPTERPVEAPSGPGDAAATRLLGHVVLKFADPGAPTAEVGYWTAAPARGRGVAPRALRTLTDWAFTAFGADSPQRLELLHQADNTASCRVAEKCGYALTGRLPAFPSDFPVEGHVHTRSTRWPDVELASMS